MVGDKPSLAKHIENQACQCPIKDDRGSPGTHIVAHRHSSLGLCRNATYRRPDNGRPPEPIKLRIGKSFAAGTGRCFCRTENRHREHLNLRPRPGTGSSSQHLNHHAMAQGSLNIAESPGSMAELKTGKGVLMAHEVEIRKKPFGRLQS